MEHEKDGSVFRHLVSCRGHIAQIEIFMDDHEERAGKDL
jgi:hypothetical protein